MSKRQNDITWNPFKAALEGGKDLATNIGFRMIDGQMGTYEQQKLGLSAYYNKRWVLEDGIHKEPTSFTVSQAAGAAVYREGQPKALNGQTRVLGRQTSNR